jgi:hypothetical protein
MKTYLRLDMYINSREYLIAETEVSENGFESAVAAAGLVFQASDDEIYTKGYTMLTAEQMADEDQLAIIEDYAGREINASDEVRYMMCLWRINEDGEPEHVRSEVKLAEME